jgi:hypothetical protein
VAVKLGTDARKREQLRTQVMARRRGANLYNTRKWVYHLEQTVTSVWDTYLAKGGLYHTSVA